MFNYIGSDTYFLQPPEIPLIANEPNNHPTKYEQGNVFAIDYLQFSHAWLDENYAIIHEIQVWRDFLEFFNGN